MNRNEVHQKLFTPLLEKSNFYVWMVAELLAHRGWKNVEWEVSTTTENRDDAVSDNGDIYAEWNGKRHRIEVRFSTYTFDGPQTFPYRKLYLIEDFRLTSYDPPISFIFRVSHDMRCFGVLDVRYGMPASYAVERVQSPLYKDKKPEPVAYIHPMDMTAWIDLPPELERIRNKLMQFNPKDLHP